MIIKVVQLNPHGVFFVYRSTICNISEIENYLLELGKCQCERTFKSGHG